jgi:hypothetical protein
MGTASSVVVGGAASAATNKAVNAGKSMSGGDEPQESGFDRFVNNTAQAVSEWYDSGQQKYEQRQREALQQKNRSTADEMRKKYNLSK